MWGSGNGKRRHYYARGAVKHPSFLGISVDSGRGTAGASCVSKGKLLRQVGSIALKETAQKFGGYDRAHARVHGRCHDLARVALRTSQRVVLRRSRDLHEYTPSCMILLSEQDNADLNCER